MKNELLFDLIVCLCKLGCTRDEVKKIASLIQGQNGKGKRRQLPGVRKMKGDMT